MLCQSYWKGNSLNCILFVLLYIQQQCFCTTNGKTVLQIIWFCHLTCYRFTPLINGKWEWRFCYFLISINFNTFLVNFQPTNLLYTLLLRFSTTDETLTECDELMVFLVSTNSSVCSDNTKSHLIWLPLSEESQRYYKSISM